MSFAPSVASLGAEHLANHGMELRSPLITVPSGRYQGAPALIPAVRLSTSDLRGDDVLWAGSCYSKFPSVLYARREALLTRHPALYQRKEVSTWTPGGRCIVTRPALTMPAP